MKPRSVWQQMLLSTPAHVRRHPLRYFLSILSIAVAVALFVSMRSTQASLMAAFRGNVRALAGAAEYAVRRTTGLTMADLARLERIAGVRAAPIIQGSAILPAHHQTVMVLGIDAVRDARLRGYELDQRVKLDLPTLLLRPNAVVIPRKLADRYGWTLGSTVDLAGPSGTQAFAVGGLLEDAGPASALDGQIVIMHLPVARHFFERGERIDRIELAVDPPATIEAVRAALGDAYAVDKIGAADPTFDYLYAQFQVILVCVSLLASVIALFIVYNAMSLSVLQRAKEIGVFRALGARRREILLAITLEAALVGLVASMLGAAGGRLIAGEALRQSAVTLNIMIDYGSPTLVVPIDAWLLAPAVGVLAAVLGALAPARIAAALPPIAAMRPQEVEQSLQLRAGLWMITGIILLTACFLIVRHPRTTWLPTSAGLMSGLIGVALIGPQILVWITPALQRLGRRISSVPALLALDNVLKFPSRTSLTTVALGGSLSLVVAVTSMIGGLEAEVSRWMENVFAFDLVVQSNDLANQAYSRGSVPNRLWDEVLADPRCEDAYGVRAILLPFAGDEVMLIAYDVQRFHDGRIRRGKSRHPEADRRRARALQAGQVDVSHNFARIHGLKPGDEITLETPAGRRSWEIHTVQTDYSWFRGCVFMDLARYRELWNDNALSYLDVRAKPGVDHEAFRADLTRRWGDHYGLFVYRVDQLKNHARQLMRDWFDLANLQLVLAVVIGGVGVANTLLISVLMQTRQIGLLRAIGATGGQVQRMLAIEAGLLGLVGGIVGCGLGLATVRLLVAPMSLKATGYEIPTMIPYGPMAAAIGAAVLIAFGAAVIPFRAVRRIDVIAAIGYE